MLTLSSVRNRRCLTIEVEHGTAHTSMSTKLGTTRGLIPPRVIVTICTTGTTGIASVWISPTRSNTNTSPTKQKHMTKYISMALAEFVEGPTHPAQCSCGETIAIQTTGEYGTPCTVIICDACYDAASWYDQFITKTKAQ